MDNGNACKKVLEAQIYTQKRKIIHTHDNPRSPRNKLAHLPHKTKLWNRKPNFRLRLHHLNVFGFELQLHKPAVKQPI